MSFKDKKKKREKAKRACNLLQDDKRSVYDIVKRYIFTEKNHNLKKEENVYVFEVEKNANKNDIKAAIKAIYNVDPKKVNTVNTQEKRRARRGLVRKSIKKAYVKLEEDDEIQIVEK